MSSTTRRAFASMVSAAMVVLIVVGVVTHTYVASIVGVIGALPSLSRFFTRRSGGTVSSDSYEPGTTETIRGPVRSHPSKPIGQAAIDDPPDTAPVAEKLKRLRHN